MHLFGAPHSVPWLGRGQLPLLHITQQLRAPPGLVTASSTRPCAQLLLGPSLPSARPPRITAAFLRASQPDSDSLCGDDNKLPVFLFNPYGLLHTTTILLPSLSSTARSFCLPR